MELVREYALYRQLGPYLDRVNRGGKVREVGEAGASEETERSPGVSRDLWRSAAVVPAAAPWRDALHHMAAARGRLRGPAHH